MPNKSLSVSKEDQELWAQGEALASAARQSMSGYVLTLIERDVAARTGPVVDGTKLCVVDMHAPGKPPWRESFTGKWLTSERGIVDASWEETGMTWSLGITAAGRPVAYRSLQPRDRSLDSVTSEAHLERMKSWSRNKCESLLLVFDNAEEMAKALPQHGFPETSVQRWTAALTGGVVHHHEEW